MKITICGSIKFIDEMNEIKEKLENLGHFVKIPPKVIQDKNGKDLNAKDYYQIRKTASQEESDVWDMKEQAMLRHFEKIKWADAILVLNIDKKGIIGYIGANTLMEMGISQYLKKPIYLWKDIPKMDYTEEILGSKPIVIFEDLKKIK